MVGSACGAVSGAHPVAAMRAAALHTIGPAIALHTIGPAIEYLAQNAAL